MSTPPNVATLSRNTHPVPIRLISTPEMAGPTMRAVLNVMELSAMALDRCSLPTISMVND